MTELNDDMRLSIAQALGIPRVYLLDAHELKELERVLKLALDARNPTTPDAATANESGHESEAKRTEAE